MTCDIFKQLSVASLLWTLGVVAYAADPVAEALAGNMLPADSAMTSYTVVLNAIERADADADDAWRRLGSRNRRTSREDTAGIIGETPHWVLRFWLIIALFWQDRAISVVVRL